MDTASEEECGEFASLEFRGLHSYHASVMTKVRRLCVFHFFPIFIFVRAPRPCFRKYKIEPRMEDYGFDNETELSDPVTPWGEESYKQGRHEPSHRAPRAAVSNSTRLRSLLSVARAPSIKIERHTRT